MRAVLALLIACGGGSGGALDGPGGGGDPVGRICDLGTTVPMDQTVVASPALDCPSRTCLHAGGASISMCTSECETAADCASAPESMCSAGFVCVPAVEVGPFSCRKFCVCADHVPVTSCP